MVAGLILLPLAAGLDSDGWDRLGTLDSKFVILLICGTVVTALFQSLLVATESVTLAITAGVLSSAAIVPQLIIAFAIDPKSPLAPIQIAGYVLAPVAAIAYLAFGLYEKQRTFKSVA